MGVVVVVVVACIAQAVYCYRQSSVVYSLSVCLSVGYDHEPCKTAQPIKISFGMWTPGSQMRDKFGSPGNGQF